MLYRINEVAQLLNLSSQTLRTYEELGVVRPQKREGSSYRYFSPWDLVLLSTCRHYRSFNFSLNDAVSFLHAGDPSDIFSLLREREDQMERELRRQQQLLEAIHAWSRMAEQAWASIGQYDMIESIDTWVLPYQEDDHLITDPQCRTELSDWISLIPYVYTTVLTHMEPEGRPEGFTVNLAMADIGMKVFGIVPSQHMLRLPPKRCLRGVFMLEEEHLESGIHFRQMYEQAERLGVHLTGNFRCDMVINHEENGHPCSLTTCLAELETE